MKRRRLRGVGDGENSDESCCGSSSENDKGVGLSLRDRVCLELRDLQVFFFFLPVCLHTLLAHCNNCLHLNLNRIGFLLACLLAHCNI